MTNVAQLYVVATPIGNLSDISFRAIDVLKQVDLILSEDTRTSQKLLSHYGIETKLQAFHDHNEKHVTKRVIESLQAGKTMALISDAGTPLISDPGYTLIKACHEAGVQVSPIPGASASVVAMCVSGLPCDKFFFVGFLPTQDKAKQLLLDKIIHAEHTTILYESPRRVVDLLKTLVEQLEPERLVTVARELTKKFETIRTDRLDIIYDWISAEDTETRGEFVILIGPNQQSHEVELTDEVIRILKLLLAEMPPKKACKIAGEITGLSHKKLYQVAIEL